MWNILCIILIVLEILILGWFIIGKLKRKRMNEAIIFLIMVYMVNLAVHFVPFLHSLIELKENSVYAFEIFKCFLDAFELFLGGINIKEATVFAEYYSIYAYTYLLGALLAILGTVSTAIEAFSTKIINSIRLSKVLKEKNCDIIIGNSPSALEYALKNNNCVLLLDDKVSKETTTSLMESGYCVLKRNFDEGFLTSKMLNNNSVYNIICFGEGEEFFHYINTFISYQNRDSTKRKLKLFVEVNETKIETIRREIVDKSQCKEAITLFSRNELLVKDFIDNHPVTEFLPEDFIDDDSSIKTDKKINVFMLGFSKLSEELYKQYIINNQLVCFDKEYQVFPLNYEIYENNRDCSNILAINELKNDLKELQKHKKDYFSIPELPYNTTYHLKSPLLKENILKIIEKIKDKNSFSYIFIDVDDEYQDIDLGARIKTLLVNVDNYHIFVRSSSHYENDDKLDYYGDFNKLFTHDVIVNESLAFVAQKLNEVYTAGQMKKDQNKPNFNDLVKKAADESWKGLNYFSLNSNISSAMSLRIKLNLLGLDYVKDGKGEGIELINEKYPISDKEYAYKDYFIRSKRNALLAQEHARWNAYHLLAEYLPLAKNEVKIKSQDADNVKFIIKNMTSKKHACLATFKGLDILSKGLAKKANDLIDKNAKASDYDYYIYDESLILTAAQLMRELGYSIVEKYQ